MIITAAPGLYVWELEDAGGAIRYALGSSLATLLNGATPVVRAQRGQAFVPGADVAPILTLLAPATAVVTDPPLTIAITGTLFTPGCVVLADGVPLDTTYTSATAISAAFDPGPAPRTVQIEVRTLGGALSNALPFTITATA